MRCSICRRSVAGLRSPLTGRMLGHLHPAPQDSVRVAVVASVCAALAPFALLAVWVS